MGESLEANLLPRAINVYQTSVPNEHGGIRTPDPQNRNLMLYPLSYMPSAF